MRVALCSTTDVARRLGVTSQTVRNWRKSDRFWQPIHRTPEPFLTDNGQPFWTPEQVDSDWVRWFKEYREIPEYKSQNTDEEYR